MSYIEDWLVGRWREGLPLREDERRAQLEKDTAARAPDSAERYRKYGLTVEGYARLFAAQNGVCAICRRNLPLQVDHDHLTDVVRGLLCNGCNSALGFIEDSPARLRAAADYLEKRS